MDEHLTNAGKHALRTKTSWDKFLKRVRSDPEYAYRATEWYKAGADLEALKHPAPAPTPPDPPSPTGPPSPNLCIYLSTVTTDVCKWFATLGPRYTLLFSADRNLSKPEGPYYFTDEQLRIARSGGGTVASWCDCSATPYSEAVALKERRGLAFAGGQAEDHDQYRNAIEGRANHIIGNPANISWEDRTSANARISSGQLAFIGEVLHPDPAYSAQGVNISSACMYVDMDEAHGGYQPLRSFDVMPDSLKAGASIYTGARMTAEDRALYEAWTRR